MTYEAEEALVKVPEAVHEVAASIDFLANQFKSPNEVDRNMEPANVVDGLFAIARALNRIADALHEDVRRNQEGL